MSYHIYVDSMDLHQISWEMILSRIATHLIELFTPSDCLRPQNQHHDLDSAAILVAELEHITDFFLSTASKTLKRKSSYRMAMNLCKGLSKITA